MVIEELFATLGLDLDAASFAKGMLAVDGLEKALNFAVSIAKKVADELVGVVTHTADYADEMLKASQRTGTTTDEMQEFAHAASLADVSVGSLQASLNYLSRKGSKNPAKDFRDAADAVKALFDSGRGSEAPKEAIKRLGKSAGDLIPLLKGGSAGLADAGLEARELGLVLAKETLVAGEEFNDAITRAQGAVRGLTYSLGAPLLVPLRELIDGFRDWVVENRELIKTRIRQVIFGVTVALKLAWSIMRPLVKLMGYFLENSTRLRVALLALGSAILTFALMSSAGTAAMTALTALTTAWGQAALIAGARAVIAPVLAAAPWLLLIGVIGLVIEDTASALTGGRSFFGEWQNFLKSNPEDSAFMSGLKAVARVIVKLLEYTNPLVLLMNSINGIRDFADWHSNGAQIVQGKQLHEQQQRQAQLRAANTPWASGPWALPQAQAPQSVPGNAYTNAPQSFSPNITIHAPTGDAPAIREELNKWAGEFWRQQMSHAASGAD